MIIGHVGRSRTPCTRHSRRVTVAAKEALEVFVAHAREQRGVRDLPAVQVQDGQHRAVLGRVHELRRMPARRERAGLGFAVADDAGDDEVRIVECGAVRVRERVAELATFVDRARHFGCAMAWDAARERELAEQRAHARGVATNFRVVLAIRALQPRVCDERGPAVAGSDDDHDLGIALQDHAVQVRENQVQARRGAPMAEQARLDVLRSKRLAQ